MGRVNHHHAKHARPAAPPDGLPRSYRPSGPECEKTGPEAVNIGGDFTADECELLKRIDAYRRAKGLKFVPYTAVFQIVREMGYERIT